MKIRLWKGYHSEALRGLLRQTWQNDELLILVPPFLKELDFVCQLPPGEIEFCGEWAGLEIERASDETRSFPVAPVLGVFTSGTVSGVPRLVLYSKENIASSVDAILALFDESRIQSVFCYPQPFHTFGLILGYVLPMLRGFELLTGVGRYSRSFHELRAGLRTPGLLTLGTPTHFHDLLAHVRGAGRELAPSYSSIIGGARVSVTLWRQLRDTLHIEQPSIGYGATEASPGITHLPPGREPLEDGELGFVFPHLSVQLRAGRGLEFSGRSLCLAVIQNGKLEFPSTVLLSDDIRRRADDVLIYHGRTELILNRGGQKFSLEHIEEVVRRNLDVEIVCVSLPDIRLGEDLGVLVRTSSLEDASAQRARIHEAVCSAFDSKFDVANFVDVAEFPLLENAKVDRRMGIELCLSQRGGPSGGQNGLVTT